MITRVGYLVATTLLLFSCSSFAQTSAPPNPNHSQMTMAATALWGTVDGTVLDQEGKPLAGALVTAYMEEQAQEKIGAGKAIRDVTQYYANAKGVFSIQLPKGKVWLSAEKEDEGYPYAFFDFYRMPGQQFPHVSVEAHETTNVIIRVGAKAAHLVYDAVDEEGKPVTGGFFFIRLEPDGEVPFHTSGPENGHDMLVPTAPFRMTFEAKGFKPWHYGGDNWQGKEGVISLKSGEVLKLKIRLQQEAGSPYVNP